MIDCEHTTPNKATETAQRERGALTIFLDMLM
jgi:hypothetical protein